MAKKKNKEADALKKPSEYSHEENEAIRKLQRAWQVKIARDNIKRLVRQNYIKQYDRVNDEYIYKNRMTGEIKMKKPTFLGDEDLPTPRNYMAPMDYNPGDNDGDEGYALVITCAEFSHEKLPEIGGAVRNDHKYIADLLSHDLICKIRNENVLTLQEPTCDEVYKIFDQMRVMARGKAFLVVYICTHVATLWGTGQKEIGSGKSALAHF